MSSAAGIGEKSGVRLGVLLQRWPEKERPFGALTPFAQTLLGLAHFADLRVNLFGPGEIDLARDRVRHWQYGGPALGWTEAESPLPDVIWNRYFKKDQERLLGDLRARGIPFINPVGLNKWEAYQSLRTDPLFAPHLPETVLLESAADLAPLLERYPVLFLKPVSGAVGRGIIRVQREAQGLMRLQYLSAETRALREVLASDRQLNRWLWGRRRAGRFIAQQGLDLTVFHGRPADVRALVQKDGSGLWNLTGMGARVAAHGRFTANVHTGGQGVSVEMLAEAVFPQDQARCSKLICDLEALALNAARRLERVAGQMGEVGLDFGVDPAGQIWFIEQNMQPGRSIFEHLGRLDQFDLAHLRPLQYARFLAAGNSARIACPGAT